MTEKTVEQEIQAKGLGAPRVVPADIEACIASEHYFTAEEGMRGTEASLNTFAETGCVYGYLALAQVTICVMVLKNGHRIVGVNAGPVSHDNFNSELARRLSRQNAIDQIWPLEGYALRERLF